MCVDFENAGVFQGEEDEAVTAEGSRRVRGHVVGRPPVHRPSQAVLPEPEVSSGDSSDHGAFVDDDSADGTGTRVSCVVRLTGTVSLR